MIGETFTHLRVILNQAVLEKCINPEYFDISKLSISNCSENKEPLRK